MNSGDQANLSVVIAVLTYKRPETLGKLLSEYASMCRPEHVKLKLLVIDNDENGSAEQIVNSWRNRIGEVRYVVEKRRGIPVARNRAIDEATSLCAGALCFIDDDEYPDKRWIVNLAECWRKTGAQLVGGPVVVAPAPAGASGWQKMINASLASRQLRKNRAVVKATIEGARYTIVTNNWLCDLKWLTRSGIRFNESLLVTGGSDTEFFRNARAIQCVTAWCPHAIVFETMGLERLSLAYQFRRGAYQSMTNFRIKTPNPKATIILSTMLTAVLRAVLGLLLLVVPVFGRASPVMAVRSLGWAVGRTMAVFGRHSKLYE
jgi:succinoglycan biosynthesis protein ExoM